MTTWGQVLCGDSQEQSGSKVGKAFNPLLDEKDRVFSFMSR